MQKKWLWFLAAAVIMGVCACNGGAAQKGTGTAAEESLSPGEGTKDNEAGDKAGEAQESGQEDENPDKDDVKEDQEAGNLDSKDGRDRKDSDSQGVQDENPDSRYGDFCTGTWEGLTFSNSWLNMAITFPEGSAVFSEEDMRKLVGEGSEILVNTGDYEDIRQKASEALNIYDFMVTMPDGRSSVQLAYMNAEKAAPGQEISAWDCLSEMAAELSAIGDMGYELSEIEKAEMAGMVFDRFSASLMGGALYQEYYAIRVGDYVAVMTASFGEEGKAAVEALIEGIETAAS